MAIDRCLRARWPGVETSRVAAALLGVVALIGALTGGARAAGPDGRDSRAATGSIQTPRRAPQQAASARPARKGTADPAGRRDGAVVPAGGLARTQSPSGGVVQAGALVSTADCAHCGRRGCNQCRPAGGRLGLACNGKCDAGGCPAHCPVRPDQFGYYATRWRSWPGQGVRQVSHFDPATTPAVPPRSQLPTIDEESGIDEDAAGEEEAEEKPDTGDAKEAPATETAPRDDMPAESAEGTSGEGMSGDGAGADPVEKRARAGKSGEQDPVDDALDRLLEAPDRMDGASRGPGRVPPATFVGSQGPANPLRREGVDRSTAWSRGNDAEVATAIVGESASPAPRGGWQSLRRATDREDGSARPVRGVTANPGNPLR